MANTTIEDVLKKHFDKLVKENPDDNWQDWDCKENDKPKVAIYAAMQEWASIQTPSNENYWRERCELSELMYLKLNMRENHGEIYEEWEKLKSTPIPIRTPCVWVKVEDELPDEEDDVMVYMSKMGRGEYGSVYVGVYEKGKWKIVDTVDGIIQDANNNPDYWIVTHWMPLPNKPNL